MAFLVIICICYIIVALIRTTPIQNEWLPLISSVLGLTMATIAFYALPEIVPSASLGVTVVYGFFCGLAATGSNQLFKQAFKFVANRLNIDLTLPETTDDKKE